MRRRKGKTRRHSERGVSNRTRPKEGRVRLSSLGLGCKGKGGVMRRNGARGGGCEEEDCEEIKKGTRLSE